MSKVLGHWKLEKNENWDEYLQAVGVNFMLRKVATSLTIYEEIKRDGDNFEIHITSTFKNKSLKFTLGVEFEEETPDGRKVMTTFTEEDGKLCQVQKAPKGSVRIVRDTVDADTMVVTMNLLEKNVTAKRTFKRYTP